jgi:hypothetical protein
MEHGQQRLLAHAHPLTARPQQRRASGGWESMQHPGSCTFDADTDTTSGRRSEPRVAVAVDELARAS